MNNSIGFIGTGNMASAIVSGLISAQFPVKIYGYDLNKNNYDNLIKQNVKCLDSLEELAQNCKFLILAVKPQNMKNVLNELKKFLTKKHVLISIAAGVDEKFVFENLNNNEIEFIRVMPNTAILVKKGAVAICKGSNFNSNNFNFIKQLFAKTGVVVEIKPTEMDDIVAINGSSPAFIYLFAKGFLNFAKSKKIDLNSATKLFCAALNGSADMILKSGKLIDELIADVSSKGGTTIAGLSILNSFNFLNIVQSACEQTSNRAKELKKNL